MFQAGARSGLLPNQVLDMNLPQLIAWLQGYEDHLFDLRCLTAHVGYWTGYYNNSKHPKSLSSIITDLSNEYSGYKESKQIVDSPKDLESSVEQFKQREQRFNQYRG